MSGGVPPLSTKIGASSQEEGAPVPPIDLKSIVHALSRRWKLVLAIPLLALIAAYGILRITPPLYKSTAEILIFDPQRQVDEAILKRVSPLDVDAVAMNTEMEIIRSKSLALHVAKELDLDKDAEFQSKGRLSTWLERLGLRASDEGPQTPRDPDLLKEARLDRAAEILRMTHLQVDRMQFSYVLSVSVTSQDPVKAQRLAAAVADGYLVTQREARQEALHGVAVWLKGRIDELQSHVLETEASIEKLKAESGLSDTGLNQNITDQQISNLNAEVMAARAEVAEKRTHVEQITHFSQRQGGDVQAIPEVMASSVMNELHFQQLQLSQQAAILSAKALGENYPAAQTIRAQLAGINKAIDDEVGRILGNMKNAYDNAVRREQSLEATLQSLTAARGNSADYIKLQQMRRIADADRKLYESYLSQFNEASTRQTLQDATARIITPAVLPTAHSSPPPRLVYAAAGVLGLAASLLSAFLMEFFQLGVRTGVDVERAFGYPVIGAIPLVKSKRTRGRAEHGALVDSMADTSISQFHEAVRSLRIGLTLSQSEPAPKVILITSSIPGEGKSATAMLLAASSAASGTKTVLVDCDLHHHSISETFAKAHKGLVEVLTGSAAIADVLINVPAIGADVIPAGSPVQNPGDLLVSQTMRDLIDHLRDKYDYIVIDASPLLPVVDALVLATMVDKILMIIEWNRTSRVTVAEGLKILRTQPSRLVGIVLNKVDLKQLDSYRYGYVGGYRSRSFDGAHRVGV